MVRHKALRVMLAILGLLCVGLGFLGILLPILPTTPFILLAALLFSFSNQKLARWLERNRTFGPYLKHWKEGTGIPKTVKIKVLLLLWASLSFTFFLLQKPMLIAMLATIGSIVSIYIISIKPRPRVAPSKLT
ncbi:YbaN family protein [Sphaerochaeta globosa]|uniref:DUF454 domain-containing protein n=1 Tax=Sphaerochaeta globosa (strain ATCC BAA-1886 / DSM 22777 / Buddy) TaxID=158189 RepID=F0RWI4_SPHGB|nr:YbaN family protein [Sphaerochaeta globosa]ADY13615.1 protein of unknown function DUF454 [Sphaerochaeta globosa str. Buddy]